MIDIRIIRENPDALRNDLKKRDDLDKLLLVEKAIDLDKKNRKLIGEVEKLRHDRNVAAEEINQLKKAGKEAGASGWVTKPFSPSSLLSVVRMVCPV